jgi:hypothetical protein
MEFSFQFLSRQSVCIVEKVQNILLVDGECPVAFIGSERRSDRQSVKAFTKIIDAYADVW